MDSINKEIVMTKRNKTSDFLSFKTTIIFSIKIWSPAFATNCGNKPTKY